MKLGKVSGSVMKRSVWKQLHTKSKEVVNSAGVGVDCAIFAISDTENEKMASCMQEAFITVSKDEIQFFQNEPVYTMRQLIHKCTNNLAASGAVPFAAMLTLILPPDTEEIMLKELMKEAENVCMEMSVQIAGGQTRVSALVSHPMAVITGYGKIADKEKSDYGVSAPGQDIVLSKWIALEGTARLAKGNRQNLLERYPAYLVDEAACFDQYLSIIPEAATAVKSGVCAMHDASEGGIFATLWELAEKSGVGLTIDLKKIPIRQETVEVCERLGVNPYELQSGGCLVMTSQDGPRLIKALEEIQVPAVMIGKTTDSNDRLILNEDEVRYMDRPKQDAIYGME